MIPDQTTSQKLFLFCNFCAEIACIRFNDVLSIIVLHHMRTQLILKVLRLQWPENSPYIFSLLFSYHHKAYISVARGSLVVVLVQSSFFAGFHCYNLSLCDFVASHPWEGFFPLFIGPINVHYAKLVHFRFHCWRISLLNSPGVTWGWESSTDVLPNGFIFNSLIKSNYFESKS